MNTVFLYTGYVLALELERLKIETAFAFDRHSVQAGFRTQISPSRILGLRDKAYLRFKVRTRMLDAIWMK